MPTLSRRTVLMSGLSVAILAPALGFAAEEPAEFFEGDTKGVAINGADPVAYFTEGRPVAGKPEHSIAWGGTTWRFASAENRAAFEKDPLAFAPQYNGYCAYGVAQGSKVKTEPDAWSIVDGKLYLNYDENVQNLFSQDARGYIATADRKWPKVK